MKRVARSTDPRLVAFRPLVEKYARRFTWVCANVYTTDELAALGMVALWNATRTWTPQGGASFATFARRAVKFAMCSAAKASRSYRRIPYGHLVPAEQPDDDSVSWRELRADDPSPEESLIMNRGAARIPLAMEALPPRLRLVVRRRFYQDRTLQELADELGVSRERARQLEVSALSRLREFMKLVPETLAAHRIEGVAA